MFHDALDFICTRDLQITCWINKLYDNGKFSIWNRSQTVLVTWNCYIEVTQRTRESFLMSTYNFWPQLKVKIYLSTNIQKDKQHIFATAASKKKSCVFFCTVGVCPDQWTPPAEWCGTEVYADILVCVYQNTSFNWHLRASSIKRKKKFNYRNYREHSSSSCNLPPPLAHQ